MTTYWLLGEDTEDKSEDEYDFTAENDDEGIDDVDEDSLHTTVIFRVSDHDTLTGDDPGCEDFRRS